MKRVAGHWETSRQCVHGHGGDRVGGVFKENMEATMVGTVSEGEQVMQGGRRAGRGVILQGLEGQSKDMDYSK